MEKNLNNPLFSLSGKTALVTGSSRGLGQAIALGFLQAGARVILNGVNAERLANVAETMKIGGHDVLAEAFDVTDEAQVVAAFERLDAAGVAVDIVVNNAGIQLRKPLVDFQADEWRRVMETNLTSAFIVGREAGRRMIPRGHGKVINIGSLMSDFARPTVAPYTSAKAGIKALTQSMAAEWAQHGIQANAIAPGYMLTDMNEALTSNPEFDAWVKGRTPSKRWGNPDELAGAAVFLAAPASNYVNGQIIYVDGGMSAVL